MQRIHVCDFLNALGLNFVAEKGKKEDSQIALGLVHTSDEIGSGVGIGSARSVTIQCKSKSGIGSGVGSSKESESEGSEEFLFLPIPLLLQSWPIHTRSELSSDWDSAYDSASVVSVTSVNQPL